MTVGGTHGMISPMTAEETPRDISQEATTSASGNRVEAAAILVIVAGVLALARILQPDPVGFGTHEQLFAIPCAFQWLTGLPCPACGLTTAFSLMARGEVLAALSAHVLGPVFYAGTWALAASSLVGLVRDRPPIPRWLSGAAGARGLLLVIGGGWVVNLVMHIVGG